MAEQLLPSKKILHMCQLMTLKIAQFSQHPCFSQAIVPLLAVPHSGAAETECCWVGSEAPMILPELCSSPPCHHLSWETLGRQKA